MRDNRTAPGSDASLRPYVRPAPALRASDSIGQAARALAQLRLGVLPVTDDRGTLVGVVTARRIRSLLAQCGGSEELDTPITAVVEPAAACVPSDSTAAEAVRAAADGEVEAVLVVGERGRLAGMVLWDDLLLPHDRTTPSMSSGGMATPFGIHLSCGGVRAGISSPGLLVGGLVLGLMLAASYVAVGLLCLGVDRVTGAHWASLWTRLDPPAGVGLTAAWLALQALSAGLFLVMLRSSPVAGYHGAEHQVVHALEQGRRLDPDVVAQMPRVHPRCGTNVLAAVTAFVAIVYAVSAFDPFGAGTLIGSLVGAAVTLRTWRRLGDALQQRVTTRPPNRRQLERAIAAARELRERYASMQPAATTRLSRLWLTGVPQMAVGVFAGLGIPTLLLGWWAGLLVGPGGGIRLW